MAQSGFTPIQLYRTATASATPTAGNLADGELAINTNDGKLFYKDSGGTVQLLASKAGASGDVVGPASSTDNAVVRFDGTTGKLVQNSVVTIADSTGDVAGVGALTASGAVTLSGGTANGVAYLNGSKVLTTGSALTFDGTVLNASAGTPIIKATASTVGALYGLEFNGGALDAFVKAQPNNSELRIASGRSAGWGGFTSFYIDTAEQARLTSTGLGIGTSSPVTPLQIYKASGDSKMRITSGSNNLTIGWDDPNGFYYTASSGLQAWQTGGTTRMTLDTSGNLGIGTSSPGFKLQVIGTSQMSLSAAGTQQALQLNNSDTTAGTQAVKLGFSSAGVTKASINAAVYGNDYMTFNVGSDTERMRLDASGNLLVGGTTSYGRLTTYGNLVSVGDGPDAGVSLRSTSGRDSYGLFNINESGTASALGFYWIDGSGNPSTGTERLRLDSSGNLGLGVTPSATSSIYKNFQTGGAVLMGGAGGIDLYLNGNATFNGGWKYINNGAAARYSQNDVSPGTHTWFTAPSGTAGNAISFTQAMTLDASGRLAIGTTSPIAFSNQTSVTVNGTNNGRFDIKVGDTHTAAFVGGSSAVEFSAITNVPMTFATNSTERARITSGGDVGIGTTSPFAVLAVSKAQGGASTVIGVQNDGTVGASTKAGFGFYDGGVIRAGLLRTRDGSSSPISLETYDVVPLLFGTNNTERARIDSSGNLLVGTTSSGLGEPRASIYAGGAGSRHALSIKGSTDSGYDVQLVWHPATSGTRRLIEFGVGTVYTTVGNIASDGSTTSYNTSSDYRLKEDIQPMTGALAKVAALKPCTYKWKADGSDGEGFIAHELAEVVPQCVTGEKDAVDADGNPQYQGIDTSFLVATLAAAIKELKAEFDAYKVTHP